MGTFGDRLREARTAVGFTQDQLGFEVGVTKSSVSAWENNKDVPSFALLPKLRQALRVSLDDLVCGDGEAKRQARGVMRIMEPQADYDAQPDTSRAQDSKEYALLLRYRSLSPRQRAGLLELIRKD